MLAGKHSHTHTHLAGTFTGGGGAFYQNTHPGALWGSRDPLGVGPRKVGKLNELIRFVKTIINSDRVFVVQGKSVIRREVSPSGQRGMVVVVEGERYGGGGVGRGMVVV